MALLLEAPEELRFKEESDMVDIVVLETLEDMDQDKDGGISEAEYIRDIYKVRRQDHSQSVVEQLTCSGRGGRLRA